MSKKEEGIHKVSREPCGCVRKPEQDSNWGAEVTKRALLSAEDRMRLIVVDHIMGNYSWTCYSHLQQAGYIVLYFCHMCNEIVTNRKLPCYWSDGCLTCIAVIGLQCRPESRFTLQRANMRYVESERLVWILFSLNQYALVWDTETQESTLNSEFLVLFYVTQSKKRAVFIRYERSIVDASVKYCIYK